MQRVQAFLAVVLQQGLPDQAFAVVAASDLDLLRSELCCQVHQVQHTSRHQLSSLHTMVLMPTLRVVAGMAEVPCDIFRTPQNAPIAKSIHEESICCQPASQGSGHPLLQSLQKSIGQAYQGLGLRYAD